MKLHHQDITKNRKWKSKKENYTNRAPRVVPPTVAHPTLSSLFSEHFLSQRPTNALPPFSPFFFRFSFSAQKKKKWKTVPSSLSKKTKTLFSSPFLCCLGSQLGPLLPFLSQLPNGQPLLPFSSFLL